MYVLIQSPIQTLTDPNNAQLDNAYSWPYQYANNHMTYDLFLRSPAQTLTESDNAQLDNAVWPYQYANNHMTYDLFLTSAYIRSLGCSLPRALRFALAFSVASLPQDLCFAFTFLVALR